MTAPLQKYKEAIAEYLSISDDNVTLFWKGRVALYAILKAMDIKTGDEVVLPAFTCVVVPNAIIYAGAKPVYADIDPQTYNIDVSKIEEKITANTKAIIAQNTFGLSPDMDAIMGIAKKYDLWVIDDCTHGFGSTYKGRKSGTIAHAAFFSTQWNKPFSTGIGGIAVTTDNKLAEKLSNIEKRAKTPSQKEKLFLQLLIFVRKNILSSSNYWKLVKLYRWLSRHNLIIGSSQGEELQKPEIPEGFLKKMSTVQAKKGIQQINLIKQNIDHRISVVAQYKAILKDLGLSFPSEPDYAGNIYLKFPLLVNDRDKFLREAEQNQIEISDWFLSPIHPIQSGFNLWKYNYGENPVAEKISRHMVTLPTHKDIDKNYINKLKVFLKNHKKELINYDPLLPTPH